MSRISKCGYLQHKSLLRASHQVYSRFTFCTRPKGSTAQNEEQATQLPRAANYAVFPVNRFGCGPAPQFPSYPSNNHVKEVKQEASYWQNVAAEVSAGRGATGSQLTFNSRSSAAELAAEHCKTAKAEQLLNSAYAYAENLEQSVADRESELISSQGALQRSKRAHEQSNTKMASQEEELSHVKETNLYMTGSIALLEKTVAVMEADAAVIEQRHQEELDALNLAHDVEAEQHTQKVADLQAELEEQCTGHYMESKCAQVIRDKALEQQQSLDHCVESLMVASTNLCDAKEQIEVLENSLAVSQRDIFSVQCQTTELKALLKAKVGKTQLAQQQQMAAQAESAAEVANLRSLLECEVKKGAQAEEQHKAAQADLTEQLRCATSLTHQLEQERLNTSMLAGCPKTEELVQKVAELQADLDEEQRARQREFQRAQGIGELALEQHQGLELALTYMAKMGIKIQSCQFVAKALQTSLSASEQEVSNVRSDMGSQIAELETLLEAEADLAEQLRDAASLIHQLDTRQIQLLSQASEDALTIQRQSEQASQLQADISAADAKAAAAEQHAHAQQQQLQAVIADRDAAYDHAKVLQGQQLTGSQAAATKKEEELKQLHQADIESQVELVRELQEQLAAAHTAQGILQQDSKAHQLDVVHLKGQLKTASGDRDRLQDQLKAASSNAAQEGSLEQALADIEQLQAELQTALRDRNHYKGKLQAAKAKLNSIVAMH
ncbi:hypothetical protein WJX82_009233 [Trebouxia sp. C0006]